MEDQSDYLYYFIYNFKDKFQLLISWGIDMYLC